MDTRTLTVAVELRTRGGKALSRTEESLTLRGLDYALDLPEGSTVDVPVSIKVGDETLALLVPFPLDHEAVTLVVPLMLDPVEETEHLIERDSSGRMTGVRAERYALSA